MMMTTWRALAVAGLWLATGAAVRADMIDKSGMKAWEQCALCHGLGGDSPMAKFPKLAGQPHGYLVNQLEDFRTDRRRNDGGPMVSAVELLSPTDIDTVARYFSALPPPTPAETVETVETVDAQTVGKALFDRGKPEQGVPACQQCHGERSAPKAARPRLEAQHAAYLTKQLMDFREAVRTNDPDGQMRRIATALTKQEIHAVASYAASLPRPNGASR